MHSHNITEKLTWSEIDRYLIKYPLSINALSLSNISKKHPDAFSKCQLYTKLKLAEELCPYIINLNINSNAVVCGSWVGLTVKALDSILQSFNEYGILFHIDCYDLDEEAINISKKLIDNPTIPASSMVGDIYDIDYSQYDLIINPIMEHIPDTKKWMDLLPEGALVAITSTNYTDPVDHINISTSMGEFYNQVRGHLDIKKTITLEFPIYERYIIIGKCKNN